MKDILYKVLTPEDIDMHRTEMIYLMEVVLCDNITQKYPDNLPEQYVQKMPEYIQDGSAMIIGCFFNNKLVGFSWAYELSIFRERRFHIDMICVDNNYRKMGIAHYLLNEQIKEAKRREIKIVEAMTTRANENSYNWFHSVGFEDERVKVKLELA